MLSNNGKEFNNYKVKEWAKRNVVKIQFSVPIYHASNVRVKRANRTIRDALKKTNEKFK